MSSFLRVRISSGIAHFHIFTGTERGSLVTTHDKKQDKFFSFVLSLFEVKFEKFILFI